MGGGGGGVIQLSSDGDDGKIVLGLKFSIPGSNVFIFVLYNLIPSENLLNLLKDFF